MENLTQTQIENIIKNGLISKCTDYEKKQVFDFAFGKRFMKSKDKGAKKLYKEI
jgi:hypothetical protein